MLRALKYRNYRLFFGGQVVSLIGTWITTTATNWLVYRLTGSALLLGVVGFAGQFPAFVAGPFAGIFVDRWNRHRLLVTTQTLSMLTSFALAVLTLTGTITIPWLIAVSVVQAADSAYPFVRIRKMMTDVAFAHCSKKGVRNGMREDVGIRMSIESAIVRNFHSAQNQFSPRHKSVHVVSNSTTNHKITILSRSRRWKQ